jgi:broad specificity phosphatase PhoE
MKKLYYMRHGESVLNTKLLYAGRTETPLTAEGQAQAQTAGRAAKVQNVHIDLIVTSPLERAIETAQIFAEEIGLSPKKIVIDKQLIERDFGNLEGKPWTPVHDSAYQHQFDIETNDQLVARAKKALDWIKTLPADNVLVVSHGGFGRALRSIMREDYHIDHPERLANAHLYEWL